MGDTVTKRRTAKKAAPPPERKEWRCQFCGAVGPSFFWLFKRHRCPPQDSYTIRSDPE